MVQFYKWNPAFVENRKWDRKKWKRALATIFSTLSINSLLGRIATRECIQADRKKKTFLFKNWIYKPL